MNDAAQELFKASELSNYYASIELMLEDEENELNDNMHEIADNNVDIYYHDIYKSLPDVIDYIEQARDEGLIVGNESIDKQIQIGQYVRNLENLQEDFNAIKYAYNHAKITMTKLTLTPDSNGYITHDLFDYYEKQTTKIGKKVYQVLNEELIAGVILDHNTFWFEFYQNTDAPEYAYNHIKKLLEKSGYKYLYN